MYGLYGNLTSSPVKRKQAFSNPMSPLNVLSSILPGEKIEDFHFKAVFQWDPQYYIWLQYHSF